jgi:alpha-1,6-mannosyltransferase
VTGPAVAPHRVSFLVPGVTGLLGSGCVVLGASQPGSPFTVTGVGAWFFGNTAGAGPVGANQRFLGIMLVYVGVALMLGSWFEVVRTVRARPGIPVGGVVVVGTAWALPIFVGPPLFSGDVYSYAAQGEMVTLGVNPYVHGPSVLGSGPFLNLVDPLWRRVPSPYGPAWERLSGWLVTWSGHDVLASLVGFRLVALAGVILLTWGVVVLARSLGRDPTVAVTLAVLNPLVLLDLLGGAHNDALMLGLLVSGCALGRRGNTVTGLVLCTLAAEVKIPALIGVVFIGWWWAGAGAGWRERWPRMVLAVGIAGAVLAIIGVAAGLGWRWVGGLSNPGVVVSWLDPATAVGLLAARASHLVGEAGHQAAFVRGSRILGLVIAAAVSLVFLVRSERPIRSPDPARSEGGGALSAIGWSLLAFVVLGPVVWPWYETWGFVFLAVVAEGWVVVVILVASAVACLADVPHPDLLVSGNPVVVGLCWVGLAGAVVLYLFTRVRGKGAGARCPPAPTSAAVGPGDVLDGELLGPGGAALEADGLHVTPRAQHPGAGVVQHHDE